MRVRRRWRAVLIPQPGKSDDESALAAGSLMADDVAR
jgi:hypothetical protein